MSPHPYSSPIPSPLPHWERGERPVSILFWFGKDFLIPLDGPVKEAIERRIAQTGGTGPLFWKITPGDDYPRQLKDANRELRELTGELQLADPSSVPPFQK